MAFLKNISDDSITDTELVARFKSGGDLKILGDLYQRYMDLVYGVCLKYLEDKELARDAVMQIFEELGQKVQKFEIENFKSWLYTVARNFCLMQLRSNRIRTTELNPTIMQSEEELHLNGAPDREADLVKMEKCMETLSADQRQAVEMFYLQRKSYNEIATATGIEWKKVRSLIQNGKRNLRLCMEKSVELNRET